MNKNKKTLKIYNIYLFISKWKIYKKWEVILTNVVEMIVIVLYKY